MRENNKFDISYLGSNIIVKVLNKKWETEDFYEELGDIDIVECNEISYDGSSILVDSSGDVFKIDLNFFYNLRKSGTCMIQKESGLVDYVDLNNPYTRKFLAWYFATTTECRDEVKEQTDAIKLMFEQAGWTCTDPDMNQWGCNLGEKVYGFKQGMKYPDGSIIYETAVIDLNDYTDDEINDHLSPYGWNIPQLLEENSKEGAEWLMAECIFEQTV